MKRLLMALVMTPLVSSMAMGCGSASLRNPVIVPTGDAESWDGYQAAVTTTEALGYPIVARDPHHRVLLVKTKPVAKQGEERGVVTGTYFEILAMPSSVDIFVENPGGHALDRQDSEGLRRQMEQLSWGIGPRARMLGGEPSPS